MLLYVYNLATQEKRYYTCTPGEAIVAAFEQEHGNWNTWTYEQKPHKIEESDNFLFLGDWGVAKG